MRDGVASKDYVNLELLNDQLKNLDLSINNIDNELEYAHLTINTINELKNNSSNEELVVPIGNGIFFSINKPKINDKIRIAIGAGVIVEKNFDEAIKFINKQIDQLNKQREESLNLYDRVSSQAIELQQKIESKLRTKNKVQ